MKRFGRRSQTGLGLVGLSLSLLLAGCSGPTDGKQNTVVLASLDTSPIAEAPEPTVAAPISTTPKAVEPKPADYDTKYGSIKGRLVWGGDSIPEPRILVRQGDNSVKDPNVCAVHNLVTRNVIVNKDNKGFANAFAYINKPNGSNSYRVSELAGQNPTVTIDQVNCEYIPYATAMMAGQILNLKSSDPVNHNARSELFNYALPANGSTPVPPISPQRSPIELKCDIHPWMSGWFYVLDHPFYAVSDENGNFEIVGLPAGPQKLVIRTGPDGFIGEGKGAGKDVEVKAGQAVDIGEILIDPSQIRG